LAVDDGGMGRVAAVQLDGVVATLAGHVLAFFRAR
jgi:hypothetical protein